VVTVRKLVFEQDPFSFGDKVLEKWYPTLEAGPHAASSLMPQSALRDSGPCVVEKIAFWSAGPKCGNYFRVAESGRRCDVTVTK
jgi:hypothetical protein